MEGLVNFARVGYAAPVYVFSYRQTARHVGVGDVDGGADFASTDADR